MAKKSLQEKFLDSKHSKVEVLDNDFSDMKAGEKMFIASPQIVDDYIRKIPKGKHVPVKSMRKDLAMENGADNTCPLTTGIFLRIAAEKNYEDLLNGKAVNKISPFWRVIDPKSPLLKKLSFGKEFIIEQHFKEKLFT